MIKKILFICLITIIVACNTRITSKSGNTDSDSLELSDAFISEHSSRSAVDWAGVYKGTLPCADCEGIVIEIRLNEDQTYEKVMTYLGKGDNVFKESGQFEWDENGGKIWIIDESTNFKEWYQVGENRLIALDTEGNKIEGNIPEEMYILDKIDIDYVITEKHWRLIELGGKKIEPSTEEFGREAHFVLHRNDNRISGNTGCNNLMGNYKLSEEFSNEGEATFSQLATTRMACFEIDYEQEYLTAFEGLVSYKIQDDTLSFYKTNETPVAVFQAVYLGK